MIGWWANPLPHFEEKTTQMLHGTGIATYISINLSLKEAPSRLRSFWGQVWLQKGQVCSCNENIENKTPKTSRSFKQPDSALSRKGTLGGFTSLRKVTAGRLAKVPSFTSHLKSRPSCSTKSYRCTCTPRRSFRGGTGAGRSSQRPSNPVMVRNSASATWWYTTTAPQGTIATVHGMHQNVSTFFLPKYGTLPLFLLQVGNTSSNGPFSIHFGTSVRIVQTAMTGLQLRTFCVFSKRGLGFVYVHCRAMIQRLEQR